MRDTLLQNNKIIRTKNIHSNIELGTAKADVYSRLVKSSA